MLPAGLELLLTEPDHCDVNYTRTVYANCQRPRHGNAPNGLRSSVMRLHRFSIALAAGLAVAASLAPAQRPAAEPRAVAPRGPLLPAEQSLIRLFETTSPSVAYIFIERLQATSFFTAEVARGAGSGFVWDNAGHIVTNYHVVEDARTVKVQLDAGRVYSARVVGVAPDYDLAVVKLGETVPGLKPIPIGTSSDLRIGQSVYAIGNPFGLTRTLTSGIVSALDRHLPTSDIREIAGAIQTDAAINPGNSGGPLLDSAGHLIGVNTQIVSPSGAFAGVGFAVPVDTINRIVPQLVAFGKVIRPGLGLSFYSEQIAQRWGIEGAVILRVFRGSAAEKAGLRGARQLNTGEVELGDIIVGLDGEPVANVDDLRSILDKRKVGDQVVVEYLREDAKKKTTVTLQQLN